MPAEFAVASNLLPLTLIEPEIFGDALAAEAAVMTEYAVGLAGAGLPLGCGGAASSEIRISARRTQLLLKSLPVISKSALPTGRASTV